MSENNGWFPIETAPTDSTSRVLVWMGSASAPYARVMAPDGDLWRDRSWNGVREYVPTHWRPLPAPPVNAE